MVINGYQWLLIVIKGYQWLSMVISGYQWLLMANTDQLLLMDING